jgi:23S rRNA (guanosine2251-2'-O)-methyltransferase
MHSPKELYLTVYGRMPVLEVLRDHSLEVAKVVVASNAEGPNLDVILRVARERGVKVHRASPQRVKSLAGNGRHDQGVIVDIVAPQVRPLEEFLRRDREAPAGRVHAVLLDGIINPANVGMIVRTVAAAGLEGIVLPRRGVPDVDPLVVKASAGTVFRAPLLRCPTAADALEQFRAAGFTVFGLAADASLSLYQADLPARAVFVLGSETAGVSPECRRLVDTWLSIPLAGGVESLNVASSAAVLAFELVRRRLL